MLQSLIEIIQSPVKSFIASVTGTLLGYIPSSIAVIAGVAVTPQVNFLQIAVWVFTILLAASSLVTWTQKQIDRYHSKHKHNERQDN